MVSGEGSWKKIEYILSVMLWGVLAGLMLYLTYQQAVHAWSGMEGYHSDVLAYMQEVKGIDSGYSFPYPIMFWLIALVHWILPIEWSVAVVLAVFQGTSFWLLRHYFHKYICRATSMQKWGWQQAFATLAAFGVLLYSMIFVYNHPFPGLRFYYMGVFSPNPFHNATYVAARPFSIICVFLFADLLQQYEKKVPAKTTVAFSIALLLATMTKPSFTIVLCGAAGLILLYRLIRNRFATWRNTFLLGCAFLPTFADLLYQFGGVFSGLDSTGQEAGIGFGLFKVWREYCSNYPVAVVLMIFFPLVVLLFQYRKLLINTLYRFGWQMYGMSLAMFVILYEKGFRAVDANFSWGYMIGAFFLVVSSVLVLIEDTIKSEKHWLKLLIQWGAFGIHVACGIFYFLIIFLGGSYY